MPKKIKSVLFLARLYTPHVGGVEKHLAKVCLYLHRQNIQSTIITEQYDRQLPLKETIADSTVLRIPYAAIQPGLVAKIKLWSWMATHWWLFVSHSVVHIHDVFWWVLPFSPLLKFKTFITFHGYEGPAAPTTKAKRWHQLAQHMTTASLGIGGFHRKWYGVQPSITSFGAVEKKALATDQSVKQKAKSPITKVIFIGRLAEDTSILAYLHGFKLLVESAQANKKWMLDVYGDGPLTGQAKAYATKHNLPVAFHGFVKEAADMIPKYQVAFSAGYLTILEALASKVPVVAHYTYQIKEDYLKLSPFKAWISIVNTPEQIAAAVSQPIDVSDQAFDWVSQQTWQHMLEDYFDLWTKS